MRARSKARPSFDGRHGYAFSPDVIAQANERRLDLSLLHTQVPEPVRGQGVANELARTALEYARHHQLKVDVVCPVVIHYVNKHPEYKPLLDIRGYL